jgi:hypothetical protein
LSNLYTLLNVAPTSSNAEIKSAFRKLAHLYHPDHNTSTEAAQLFMDIMYAYDVLSNASLRAKYDTSLLTNTSYMPISPKPKQQGQEQASEAYYRKYGTIKKMRHNNPNYVAPTMPYKEISTLKLILIIVAGLIVVPVFLFITVLLFYYSVDVINPLLNGNLPLVICCILFVCFLYGLIKNIKR